MAALSRRPGGTSQASGRGSAEGPEVRPQACAASPPAQAESRKPKGSQGVGTWRYGRSVKESAMSTTVMAP